MKTENNKENKSAFFAQYWGQEVAIQNEGGGTGFVYDINEATITDIRYDFLKLTPISQISDEDAIEVAKIEDNFEDPLRRGKALIRDFNHILWHQERWSEITDYLRSRGYALPWRDLSVEDLVSYGWVKIK